MKREELIGWQYSNTYPKDEADKVMDAMEARIKELEKALENAVAGGEIIKGLCERHEARIKELESENARLKAQVPKWISVKDRLPYSMERVLVCTTRGTFAPATYSPLTNSWIEHGQLLGKITHWMPLPPPPTTEESSATEKENG